MSLCTLVQMNSMDLDIPICDIRMMPDVTPFTAATETLAARLKFRQLRLLIAVADWSSVMHAARALNMSQPTATKLLQDLETDFGVLLFQRTNRGMVPTTDGDILIRHARLIVSQLSQAAEEISDLAEGNGGRVIVGTLLAASAILLPKAILALRRHRPNVLVSVKEGTNDRLMPALRTGDLDLVVGRLSEFRYRDDIAQEPLYEEPICVVVRSAHELAARERIRLQDLADREWILPPPETTLRRQIEHAFQSGGLPLPRWTIESVSLLTNRQLLRHSDLVGLWPFHVIEEEVERGHLKILPVRLGTTLGPVGMSYRENGELSPAASAFADILRDIGAELAAAHEKGAFLKAERAEHGWKELG